MYMDQLQVRDIFSKALSVGDLKDKNTCMLLLLYSNKHLELDYYWTVI